MNNEQKLKLIFSDALGLSQEKIDETLEYNQSLKWDSVAHMNLIDGIEEGFKIELEDNDLFILTSYNLTKEVLINYGICFETNNI